MFVRSLIASLLMIAMAGCRSDSEPPLPSGRLVLERTGAGAQRLAELTVTGRWCDSDTTLSLVGANHDWSFAVAVRAPWPADSSQSVTVDSSRAGGLAAIAVRPIRDSVQHAIVGHSGTVTLEPGPVLAGRYEFVSGTDSTVASFAGRFDDVTVLRICP